MFERLTELLDQNRHIEFINELASMNAIDAAEFLKKMAGGVSVRPALLVGDDLSCLALEKGAYCVIRLEN